jgi:Sulfotransferase family
MRQSGEGTALKLENKPNSMPNLFVVGAAKSGTTMLYRLFAAYPGIFVPASIKETNFMAYEGQTLPLKGPDDTIHAAARSVKDIDRYLELYSEWTSEPYAADVSPNYLASPRAAKSIKAYSPHAKIVMVLRNPVEAAYSMFVMMRRDRREPYRSFAKAFDASERRIAQGWADGWNLKRYNYGAQVRRYTDAFDPSQLFIRRYEDLRDAPDAFFEDLKGFLGIETPFDTACGIRANAAPTRLGQLQKSAAVRGVLRTGVGKVIPAPLKDTLRKRLTVPAYAMRSSEYNQALAHYRQDIVALGNLLGWDVGPWLEPR